MAPACAHVVVGDSGCLECLCTLRYLSLAGGTEWLLPIQCAPAAVIFRGCVPAGAGRTGQRYGDVPCRREPDALAAEDLWKPPGSPLGSFPGTRGLHPFPCYTCLIGYPDGPCPEHEPYHCRNG